MPKYFTDEDLPSVDVPAQGARSQSGANSQNSTPVSQNMTQAPAFDDPGFMRSALIGAGRSGDKLWAGLQQGWNTAFGNQQALDSLKVEQAEKDRAYAPLSKARPFATALGEGAPYMAIPAGGAASFAGAAARGAGAGALTAIEYGNTQERLSRGAQGAIGGALGGLLGQGVGKLLKPKTATPKGSISDEGLAAAREMNYPLTPGQRHASDAMVSYENQLAGNPYLSGRMQEIRASQRDALNAQAAKAIGQPKARNLNPDVMARANDDFAPQFQRFREADPVRYDAQYEAPLREAYDTLSNLSPVLRKETGADSVMALLKGYMGREGKSTQAKEYMADRSVIGRKIKNAEGETEHALKLLKDALDGARERSFSSPADAESWKLLNRQYKDFLALTKGNAVKDGDVQANLVKEAVRTQNPKAYKTGRTTSELEPIGRLQEALPRPADSGTARNIAIGSMWNPQHMVNAMIGKAHLNPMVNLYRQNGLLGRQAGTRLQPFAPLGGGLLGYAGFDASLESR